MRVGVAEAEAKSAQGSGAEAGARAEAAEEACAAMEAELRAAQQQVQYFVCVCACASVLALMLQMLSWQRTHRCVFVAQPLSLKSLSRDPGKGCCGARPQVLHEHPPSSCAGDARTCRSLCKPSPPLTAAGCAAAV